MVLAVLLLVLVAVAGLLGPGLLRSVLPAPTPVPTRTAPAPTPPAPTAALPQTADGSDTFDGWGVNGEGGARFLSTGTARSGRAALLVTRPSAEAGAAEPTIGQNLPVAQDSRIQVTFWASSDAGTTEGAVQVRVGTVQQAAVRLPAGPFDWTRFTVAWIVPARVHEAPLTIAASGPTTGVRLDDFAVEGQGSHGVVVQDAGFETSSAALEITNTSLVLRPDEALSVRSRSTPEAPFTWSLQEYTGGPAIRGRGRFSGGSASVPLGAVPYGYYTATFTTSAGAESVSRATNLVVTGAGPAAAAATVFGIGVHLGGESDQQLAQKVTDLAALGLRTARTDADWATIERAAGQYDFTALDRVVGAMQQVGLRPLLIPDYRNPLYDGGKTPSTAAGIAAYARFAAAVAQHYPGADIEVYNEFDFRFNNGACGKTPSCYLQLLAPTASAVRATGTTGTVAGPGIAGIGVQADWLSGFISQGGLQSVGALSFHPYVQPARPDVLDDDLARVRQMMAAAGGSATPIWFTEFGDATVPGWVGERQQAEDAARVLGVAASHQVTRVYWYDAIDDGPDRTDAEDNFGIFRAPTSLAPGAFVPKPAAAVIATSTRLLDGTTGASSAGGGTGGGARVVTFTTGDDPVRLAWSPDGTERASAGRRGTVTTMTGRTIPARSAPALRSDPMWATGGAAFVPEGDADR